MEELWKDIHQSSLQEKNPKIAHNFFQDFTTKAPIIPITINSNINYSNQFDELQDNKYGTFIRYCNSPFEALSSVITNKRVFEDVHQNIEGHGHGGGDGAGGGCELGADRRRKRMMKNRDSAARSRARRQAYTSQLEREHAELKDENAKLKKQQEQVQTLLLANSPAEVPPKRNHSRSLTAPF